VDGSSVSVVLDPQSFRTGQVGWRSRTAPPLEGFGFSAGTIAKAGPSSSVLDGLGPGLGNTFRIPDGALCAPESC